ncbi:TRAP transporter small permease [Paracoccus sp. (in: a-proteobacteria)]|uniref:TRAP transporter small permease n=1 Tax=Paracoccus sp. TaxID=267 RepID=UPI003A881343
MSAIAAALNTASNAVDRVLRVVAIFFLLMMVGLICLQVLARYGFSSPPAWTEEAARFAMVWVGLLGASVSFKAGFDPALVSFSGDTARGRRLIAGSVRAAAVGLFLGPVLWFCFFGPKMSMARSFLSRSLHTKAETFDLPMIFVAVTVPLFICAILLHGLAMIASGLTKRD